VPRDELCERVGHAILNDSLVPRSGRILLALSAGKDSMALLHIMKELSTVMDLTLGIFHLNHGTREKESDDDELFIRNISVENGCTLHVRKEFYSPDEKSFEEKARNRRYDLLNEIASSEGYDRIMTAHTKSDQAETVLMRLFTGTHIAGLRAIPRVRGIIVRPLLDCTSQEIVAYLKRNGILWREDRSNSDVKYTRNFIRHEIIPFIASRFPRSGETIPDIARAATECTDLIEEIAAIIGIKFRHNDNESEIDFGGTMVERNLFNWGAARLFTSMSIFVSRERLDEAWRRYNTRAYCAVLYSDVSSVLEKDMRGGSFVLRFRKKIKKNVLSAVEEKIVVTKSGMPNQIVEAGDFRFYVYETDYKEYSVRKCERGILFLSVDDSEDLRFRSFINGDRMLVNGSEKKIKYLMNENRCFGDEKLSIPVIITGDKIAVVPFSFINRGYDRIADDRLVHVSSKKILAICNTTIENER